MNQKNWFTKKLANKAVNDVRKFINDLIEENTSMSDKLDKLSPKRIVHLMNDYEAGKVDAFLDKHHKSCGLERMYRYIISKTPIGNVVEIECLTCHKKEDISDYDEW